MAQFNLSLDPQTLIGTQFMADLNSWAAAVKSLHSGEARPTYLVAGGLWIDTSAAGFLTLKLFDGAEDVAIFTVTSATHALALAAHAHAIADVTGLQMALDAKSATGHGHAIGDVSGLQVALDGKSATGHGHAIEDITGLAGATVSAPDVVLTHETASGVHGGSTTAGSWEVRPLNTAERNTLGASFGSNAVTLPAGTYYAEGWGVCHDLDAFQTRLRDTTGAATLLVGAPSDTNGTDSQNTSHFAGVFTLGTSSSVRMENRCGLSRATTGFGKSQSWDAQIFACLKIWKIT